MLRHRGTEWETIRRITNLYNERPMWLQLAHRRLDEAVFAAYGWDPSLSDDDLLAARLALNLQRGGQHAGLIGALLRIVDDRGADSQPA